MKKSIIVILFPSLFLTLAFRTILRSTGMQGHANSPGESNCTACHSSFNLNSGTGSISITATPSFVVNQYTPMQTYTINVMVSDPLALGFGFDTEILDPTGADGGTFSIIPSTNIQIKYFNVGNNTRTNMTHTIPHFPSAGSTTFSFVWQAPASGAANIYVSSVACNLDGTTLNDYVYTSSLQLIEYGTTGIANFKLADFNSILYPNPVKDKLNLSMYVTKNYPCNKYSLLLFGVDNNLILNIPLISNTDSIKTSVDVSDLKADCYFYSIQNGNQVIKTGRFIKE